MKGSFEVGDIISSLPCESEGKSQLRTSCQSIFHVDALLIESGIKFLVPSLEWKSIKAEMILLIQSKMLLSFWLLETQVSVTKVLGRIFYFIFLFLERKKK